MAKGKSSRLMAWILMGMLFVGLAGFGATNFGGAVQSVGTVGDIEIDINAYARAIDQELNALNAQAGRNVTLSEASAAGIDQQVLSRLVGSAALENEAARLGLSVGDEIVSREILAVPAFQGVDGSFDRDAYEFMLDRINMTVPEFEEDIRATTASGMLQRTVVEGVPAPATYIDNLLGFVLEQRDVTWAKMSAGDLPEPIGEPSEDDLVAYHQENAATFTLPDTKVITFAWLTPDMIRDTVQIDQDALEREYNARIDEFVRPERRLVERLVFGNEEDAAAAMAAIEAGETDFDTLVEERGLSLSDIDLGDLSRTDLGAAADGVFALTSPGVVGPLQSSLGPALFRMNAILSAEEISLELAEPDLRAELASDAARRQISDQIVDIDDLLAGGATLEELAADTDLELGQIDWRADVSDGIAAYETFRTAASALSTGDFPEVAVLEDGGVFAMRLDEERPPQLQPLSDVRPAVIAGWVQQQTTQALATEAQKLADAVSEGREMAGIGLPLATERAMTRDMFIETAPAGFVARAFDMEENQVIVVEGDGEVAILRLDGISQPDADDPAASILRQSLEQQISQQYGDDLLTAYSNALVSTAGVSINQTAINAVHAQYP